MSTVDTTVFHALFEAEEVDALDFQTFLDDDVAFDRLLAPGPVPAQPKV